MPFTPNSRAIIVPQRGCVPIERQLSTCLRHAIDVNYQVAAIGRDWRPEDVIATIRLGRADVVLVAFGGQSLAPEVTAAGGRVVAVHPTPHVVVVRPKVLRTAIELIQRMRIHGRLTDHEIAAVTGENTGDITEMLRRHPPRPR
jgi:hypothetical protein